MKFGPCRKRHVELLCLNVPAKEKLKPASVTSFANVVPEGSWFVSNIKGWNVKSFQDHYA